MKFKGVAFIFAMLWLVACSGGPDEIVARYNGDGQKFSPTVLKGSVEYLLYIEPEKLMVVPVDYQLNALDSFEVTEHHINLCYYNFSVASRDYDVPFVKIVAFFPTSNDKLMEFSQYVRLSSYNESLRLVFHGALVASRIETLVRKENYSIEEAEDKAYEELGTLLNINMASYRANNFSNYKDSYSREIERWNVLAPYVICRHEISDSVFYSDYLEFRDEFAKKGTVDSSMIVRAADAWLATFELSSGDKEKYLFEGVSRDTSEGLRDLDTLFFQNAYGLKCLWSKDSTVKIEKKSSAFYGRSLVSDKLYNPSNSYLYHKWRIQTPLEDSIGACVHGETKIAERQGVYYVCRNSAHQWEEESNIDTLMMFKYGTCSERYGMEGQSAYIKDTSFVCYCDDEDKCEWKVVEALSLGDSAYAKNLDLLATERFGKCKEVLHFGGAVKQLDSLYVQCSNYKWVKIDSLAFHMGVCPGGKFGKIGMMPEGNYYKCGYEGWVSITIPEAKGELCDWKSDSTYKKYDDRYFYCVDGKWSEVSEDEVIKPVLEGYVCDENRASEIKKYGDEYFTCRVGTSDIQSSNHWSASTIQERELYRYKVNYSNLCIVDRVGLFVLWSDSAQSMYGCVYDENKTYEWARIVAASKDSVKQQGIDSIGQKPFSRGKFIDNNTYEVEVDNVLYGFKEFLWNRKKKSGWDDYIIMNVSYTKKVEKKED